MASSYGTDADKSSLRAGYLSARRAIPEKDKVGSDAAIHKVLASFDIFAEAPLVLAYVSFGAEVDTRALVARLLREGRRVAVPRCNEAEHTMDFCEITCLDELSRGAHGILEPAPAAPALVTEELAGSVCLVPGLVFDADGYRVGYGGGYYDRFLAFYPGDKIALARTTQVSSNPLPHDAHDVPVDFLVTETSVWACR